MLLATALCTYTFYDVFGVLCYEAFGHIYDRDEIVFETIGLTTTETGEVDVVEMLAVFASAYTILLDACAVVYDVKEQMFRKES